MRICENGVYRDATEEELQTLEQFQPSAEEQIYQLKAELSEYDYIGIKIATGVATIEEYKDRITYMETLRNKIRELEKQLN